MSKNNQEDELCTLRLEGTIDPTKVGVNMESGKFVLESEGAVKLKLILENGDTLLEVRLEGTAISGDIVRK